MKFFSLFLIIILFPFYGWNQTVFSEDKIILDGDNGVYDITTADLDNDGDIDILIGSQYNSLSWIENLDGKGNFSANKIITTSANLVTSAAAIDIDGDGNCDAISASGNDDKIAWYRNTDGLGTFGSQNIISSNINWAWSVCAGDVDGDGDVDIVAGGSDTVALFKNNGSGGFGPIILVSNQVSHVNSIILKDIDGDGDLDIVYADKDNNRIIWQENLDGQGAFSNQIIIEDSINGPNSIYLIDMDADGDIDIITAWDDNKIIWNENLDGNGNFGSQHVITDSILNPTSVCACDIDNDGDIDVFATSSSTGKLYWLNKQDTLNTYTINDIATSNMSVISADIDGDGDLDVVSGLFYAGKVIWNENNPKPEVVQQPRDTLVCNKYTTFFKTNVKYANHYKWQIKNGSNFTDLSDTLIYSGINTDSLIVNTNYLLNQTEYRCMAYNDADTNYTDTVMLNIYTPIISNTQDTLLCYGNTIQLQVTGANSVLWETNDTTFNINVSPNTDEYFSYTATDNNTCVVTDSIKVDVIMLPAVTICNDTIICDGGNAFLYASGGETCLWSTGATSYSTIVSPTNTSNYIVTVYDSVGCNSSDTVNVQVSKPFGNQQICLVSVDVSTGKNDVMWEKIPNVGVSSYYIYKEVSSNIYNWLGAVSYDSISHFIDYSSSPMSHGDKYKIAIIDTCGNISDLDSCAFHKTINLVITSFGTTMGLVWDFYEVEDNSFVPDQYYIYRGTTPATLQLIDSVSGSFNTYNDLNITTPYYYLVGAVKNNSCNINIGGGTPQMVNFLASNIKDNSSLVGIYEHKGWYPLSIYPNPFKESTTIEFSNPDNSSYTLTLRDIIGNLIREEKTRDEKVIIKRNELSSGVYIIELFGEKNYKGKLIVE